MKILIGAGGLAIDYLSFHNPAYGVNLVDDFKKGSLLGHPIIGSIDELVENRHLMPQPAVFNCIGSVGDNSKRNEIFDKLTKAGIKTQNVIMSSFMSGDVDLGENIIANIGSQIHHGCIIDDNVVISPGVIICGGCWLFRNSFIGAGATIIQGVTICENSVIGAGSVVTHNIPPNEVWAGNPARFIKQKGM